MVKFTVQGPVANPSSRSSFLELGRLPSLPDLHSLASCHPQASQCSRSWSEVCIAVFPGSRALTAILHSYFGRLQFLSRCLLLSPGVQLPGWGRLARAGRVHASALLLGLQPSAAEEGWGRRKPAVPGPSRLPSFHKPGQRASEGALVPLRVGMETTLLAAGCCRWCFLPVFTVSCVQTLAQEVPDSCQKPQCNMEEAQSWIWGSLSYLQLLNRQSVLARKVLGLLHSCTNNLGNAVSL